MNERDIFIEALQKQAGAERAAFLDAACGQDTELRRQVEQLLAEHDKQDSFFIDSPLPGLDATIDQPITEGPGTVVGPYKLLQKIGEGGMGVVYMADQTEPVKRRVALKIIKAGMDTRQVIARFEAERQALAMMDHPNIAKVLDAGTTDSGRPYFVMELVRGVPITQYCDEHHLTPRERLELFVPVCQAIQHAHQKGVIHRDIKPSNVLVAKYDDRPVPKVIDFGVAKAIEQRLTEKTMFTQFGQVVGTPEYMSPEQAELNQLDIDTRSDVYSLGVLLYELLTGETPFDRERLRSAAFQEMLRIIREEEPPEPSLRLSTSESLPSIAANRHTEPKKLSTLVRGELDWIVMKAMEKDRTRRYETASSLAADVGRFLSEEPIEARPPTWGYKFRKFAQRNKVTMVTVGSVAAALLLGVVVSTWQAIRANVQRDRAVSAEREAKSERDRAIDSERVAKQTALLLDVSNKKESAGWFEDKWAKIRDRVGIQMEHALQSEAAALLGGMDAHCIKRFEGFNTYRVAFSNDGKEVIMVCDKIDESRPDRVLIWNADSDEVETVDPSGEGPVALCGDGAALQLTVSADGGRLAVANLLRQSDSVHLESPHPLSLESIIAWECSSDGSCLVAAARGVDATEVVLVWDEQGALLHQFTAPVAALGLSSDGRLLSAGDEEGGIIVWSVETGEKLCRLAAGHCRIHNLAFAKRKAMPPRDCSLEAHGWLLAAADSGGTVTVFDLGAGIPVTYCRGSDFDAYAVAFSPDGTTIASTGRLATRLWDLSTGRLLLAINTGNHMTDVAFSPDGNRLAVSSILSFSPAQMSVWDLQLDRGTKTLRGLVAPVSRVQFSPDSRLLAALSNDWQVAIWEVSGHLRYLINVPKGLVTDNAALAFDGEGTRFAFATGTMAKLWDLLSGAEVAKWNLPHGLVDQLAFAGTDALFLFRVETKSGELGPYGGVSPVSHPRVCRIRNLLAQTPMEPVAEITDFNLYVINADMAPTAAYVVVDGLGGENDAWQRMLKVFDLRGQELFDVPTSRSTHSNRIAIAPDGSMLGLQVSEESHSNLLAMPGGRQMRMVMEAVVQSLAPGTRHWTAWGRPGGHAKGLSLFRIEGTGPLVTLGTKGRITSVTPTFSSNGRLLAWGNADGTVMLCDLEEVRRRLSAVRLGW